MLHGHIALFDDDLHCSDIYNRFEKMDFLKGNNHIFSSKNLHSIIKTSKCTVKPV